jgi:O-antigen ligase
VSDGALTDSGDMNFGSQPESVLGAKTLSKAVNEPLLIRFTYLSLWLLPIMGFTMPTVQTIHSWQVLDLVKLCILATICFGGAYTLYANAGHPLFRKILDPLLPFYVYFLWAFSSVLWSPLKSVTIFQSGSLAAMLFVTSAVAVVCADQQRVSKVLYQLNLTLLASSLVLVVAYAIDPAMSGLDRSRIHTGGDGLIHPTAAGATASLGLLVLTLCHYIGKFDWTKKLSIPCILIHGIIVFLSNSRTATGMAAITIGCVLFWFSTNVGRAKVAMAISVICLAFVLLDPGFKLGASTVGASAEYVTRGQSGDQLKGVSGRSEMWSAIWEEYKKALVMGHGYFVTSEKGALLVWNHNSNHTAHNLLLQILSTTGAVGLLLFLLALVQSAMVSLSLLGGDRFQRRLFAIATVMSVWYLGWAQLGVSFMGPIRPESMVFFTLLGIVVGQASGFERQRVDSESGPLQLDQSVSAKP